MKLRKRYTLTAILLVCGLLVTACGTTTEKNKGNQATNAPTSDATPTNGTPTNGTGTNGTGTNGTGTNGTGMNGGLGDDILNGTDGIDGLNNGSGLNGTGTTGGGTTGSDF